MLLNDDRVLVLLLVIATSYCYQHRYLEKTSKYRLLTNDLQESREPRSIDKYATSTLKSSVITIINILMATTALPSASRAVKGAFEMDAEYYIKDLFNGNPNKLSEELKAAKKPLAYKPPRQLDSVFANEILHIIRETVVEFANSNSFKTNTDYKGLSIDVLNKIIAEKNPYYVKYYRTIAPLQTEAITDQYYFDMTMYLLYLELSNILPKSEDRVKFRECVGSRILDLLQSKYSLPKCDRIQAISGGSIDYSLYSHKLNELAGNIKSILQIFFQKGLILGYKFDEEENLMDDPYAVDTFKQVIFRWLLYLFDVNCFLFILFRDYC